MRPNFIFHSLSFLSVRWIKANLRRNTSNIHQNKKKKKEWHEWSFKNDEIAFFFTSFFFLLLLSP